MGDSIKYYQDHDLREHKEEEVLSENVEVIIKLYKHLSVEEKVQTLKHLRKLNIF